MNLTNTPPLAVSQPVSPLREMLDVLSAAVHHGLVDPATAGRIQIEQCMGMFPDADAIATALSGALAAGPAAEKALDAISPAFAQDDVIELRALCPAGGGGLALSGRLGDPTQRAALVNFIRAHIGTRNLYVGINPRSAHLAGTTQAAKAGDVTARRVVVLDFDRKDAPDVDADWTQTVDALEREAGPLMIVDSGNGVHVWVPVEPVTDPASVNATVQNLADAMSRIGADNMADPPRIIRLPFTLNLPNATKRARGATVRLALPRPQDTPQTPAGAHPKPSTVNALCTTLHGVAARLGLPGRGVGVGVAPASAPSHVGVPSNEKTPWAAPSPDLLRQALDQLPNDQGHFDTRDDFMGVAHAVKGAAIATGCEGEARDWFLAWASRWTGGGDPDADAAAWDGITNPKTGWGTLMQTLERVNPAGRDLLRQSEAQTAFAQTAAQNIAALSAQLTSGLYVVDADDPPPPPTPFLYGKHVVRWSFSIVVAPGGVGKSSLLMVEALAMATGRELLEGDRPHRALTVWYHNGEDDLSVVKRRAKGELNRRGLTNADLGGRLILSARDVTIRLARQGEDGPEMEPGVIDWLAGEIQRRGVDVLVLDPLGSLHGLSENSNEDANFLARGLRDLMDRTGVAVVLLHHTGKAAGQDLDAAGANAARGASALVDAARSVRQLVRPKAEEARRLGIPEDKRAGFFRIENGKANFAPLQAARWCRLVPEPLGNGTPEYPAGDTVATVERWTPPVAHLAQASDLALAQAALGSGAARAREGSPAWIGYIVARALGLDIATHDVKADDRSETQLANRARVRGMIDQWIASGGLLVGEEICPEKRKPFDFVRVGAPAILVDDDEMPEGEK